MTQHSLNFLLFIKKESILFYSRSSWLKKSSMMSVAIVLCPQSSTPTEISTRPSS